VSGPQAFYTRGDVDGLCSWIGLHPITTFKKNGPKREEDSQELPGPPPDVDVLKEDDYEIWAEPDPTIKICYASVREVWVPPCQLETGEVYSDGHNVRLLRKALKALCKLPLKQLETIVSFKSRWVTMDRVALAGLLQSLPHLKELEIILPPEGDVLNKFSRCFESHQAHLRSLSVLGLNTATSLHQTFSRGFEKLAFLQFTVPLDRPHQESASSPWEAHRLKEINMVFELDAPLYDPAALVCWLDQRIPFACVVSFTPNLSVHWKFYTARERSISTWQQNFRTIRYESHVARQSARPGWEKIS
jgi:hypothetical protein